MSTTTPQVQDIQQRQTHTSSSSSSSSPNSPNSPTFATCNAPNLTDPRTYLNDLPSLTPSKPTTSVSDSESDSIPERFTDEDEEESGPVALMDSLSLNPISSQNSQQQQQQQQQQLVNPQPQRTPSSQTSLTAISNNLISLSEPVPLRNNKINRKRSLSALVALRYRGGKADSEIGDEERGLLALDLDTYINSGEPECIPETRALPPSALFPTLSAVLPTSNTTTTTTMGNENPRKGASGKKKEVRISVRSSSRSGDESMEVSTKDHTKIDLDSDGLLLPTPRSEWPFGGGTGPGKTSRGFIPGRSIRDLETQSLLDPSPLLIHHHPPHPETISSGETTSTTTSTPTPID